MATNSTWRWPVLTGRVAILPCNENYDRAVNKDEGWRLLTLRIDPDVLISALACCQQLYLDNSFPNKNLLLNEARRLPINWDSALLTELFHDIPNHLVQGYSNGGPRSESAPLDGDGRTSSASQRFILYPKVFIPKPCAFGRTSN